MGRGWGGPESVRARSRRRFEGNWTHAALLDDSLTVVRLVPLAERRSVDLDDAALDERVGADELVVGRVVDDADDAGLAGRVLAAPGEVARLEAEGAVLEVATTRADGVDALSAELGSRGLTTSLVLPLLTVRRRRGTLWRKRGSGRGRARFSEPAAGSGGPGRFESALEAPVDDLAGRRTRAVRWRGEASVEASFAGDGKGRGDRRRARTHGGAALVPGRPGDTHA